MSRHLPLSAAAVLAVVVAACGGGSDEASSSTTDAPPETAESPAETSAATSTATSTETTVETAVETTVAASVATTPETTVAVPATTAPPTVPPTTVAVTTTPSADPPAEAPPTFFATTDLGLVEVDAESGSVVNTVDDFFSGDGRFRGSIRLTPDRSTIFFSEGYEDSWYACDTSVGSIGSIDVATGDVESLGRGTLVELSPDASLIAFVDSEVCLPDPEQPDLWVLTPYDRAVVRDRATGDERVFTSATPPESYGAASSVRWVDIHADGSVLVQLGSGDVHRIPAGVGGGVIQDFPVVFTTDAVPWELVGDRLIATIFGAEGSSDLVSIDILTGVVTPLASAELYMAVGVGDEGQLIAVADGEISVMPGVDLTVVDLPIDSYYYDLDW